MKYANRGDAGHRLASALTHLKDRRPGVLALPRGGVAIGFEIAQALEAPLDIVLRRKIGVPWQLELALGAITDGAALTALSTGLSRRAWTSPRTTSEPRPNGSYRRSSAA